MTLGSWPPLFLITCVAACASAEDGPPAAAVSFDRDVQPILRRRCAGCHNAEKPRGELDVTTYAAVVTGGATGKVALRIIPMKACFIRSRRTSKNPTCRQTHRESHSASSISFAAGSRAASSKSRVRQCIRHPAQPREQRQARRRGASSRQLSRPEHSRSLPSLSIRATRHSPSRGTSR